jgi:septum formation inhibitor MinC
MAQNKLKLKVESLTQIVKRLIKELQITTNLAQGVLTAFQLHLGEEEWNKLIEELRDKEKRIIEEVEEKKLEIPEEK